MKKRIRVLIDAGAGLKARAQFVVDEKVYDIYNKVKKNGKSLFIEGLLLDAYRNSKYDVLFTSKRLSLDLNTLNPYGLYLDARNDKNTLIEDLILNALHDDRYSVFFEDFDDKDPQKEDIDITNEEDIYFPMLNEEEDGDNGW